MRQLTKDILPENFINLLKVIKYNLSTKIPNHKAYIDATKNFHGLEIGGPSDIFKYYIPIYSKCSSMEFANFSSQTVWEGKLSSSTNYYKDKMGKQHIADATELGIFVDNQFDFVMSSNCIEHVANPIKALKEMMRITKNKMILVLPRKDSNFDHKRPVTTFEHLIDDYNNNVSENDLTHLEEILSLHDLKLDPPAGTFKQFQERSLRTIK